jgi:choice-of-anchor C domain-containing protein
MATASSLRPEGVKFTAGSCLVGWLTVFAVVNHVQAQELKDVIIRSKATPEKVLDAAAEKLTENGDKIQLWDYNRKQKGSPNQHWEFKSVGDGYYVIVNRASGKVLDAKRGDTGKNGCLVTQWDHSKGAANQQWRLKKNGPYYKILNRVSGKALDAAGEQLTANGCRIQLWTDNPCENQLWRLDKADPASFVIRPAPPKYDVIKQGRGPTCWILAAMAALQYSGVDLSKQVEFKGGNRYKVRLYNFANPANRGGGDTYAVESVVEFDGKTTDQDPVIKPGDKSAFWVVALHRGVVQQLHVWDPSQSIEKPHSGTADDSLGILTGRHSASVRAKHPDARRCVEEALGRRAAIVLIMDHHVRVVLKSNGDVLTMHNPYGQQETFTWKQVAEKGGGFQILETRVAKPANLLVNGSFEEGPDVDDRKPLHPGSTAIKGWKVTRGPIAYIGSHWRHADGYRGIDLHGAPGFGGIAQTFKTTKGHRYRVTFALAVNPLAQHRKIKIGVRAAGQNAEFQFDATGKSLQKMGWVIREWEFDAKGAQTTLEFYTLSDQDANHGPALDDVCVTAVAGPNLLVNGSFEEGPEVEGYIDLKAGSRAIPGWTVTRPIHLCTGWPAADGRRSLFLCGPPANGAIAQTFQSTKGQRYRVSFSLGCSNNAGRGWLNELSTMRLAVSAAGKQQEFAFDATGKTTYDLGWVTKEWEFEAIADQTTLEFRVLETSKSFWHGPALDNLRVWAVGAQ